MRRAVRTATATSLAEVRAVQAAVGTEGRPAGSSGDPVVPAGSVGNATGEDDNAPLYRCPQCNRGVEEWGPCRRCLPPNEETQEAELDLIALLNGAWPF